MSDLNQSTPDAGGAESDARDFGRSQDPTGGQQERSFGGDREGTLQQERDLNADTSQTTRQNPLGSDTTADTEQNIGGI